MRTYCQEAMRYGDQPIAATTDPKTVTVILNPAANKRSANDSFKKYCEPILHLGGFEVNIISTTSEGSARKTIEELPNLPDAILVAGGDGTLAECVTGGKKILIYQFKVLFCMLPEFTIILKFCLA